MLGDVEREPPGVVATLPARSVRLEVNGFELNAERWSGGRRAHVLLVHGLGGNSVT
jgi:hypothetical protein